MKDAAWDANLAIPRALEQNRTAAIQIHDRTIFELGSFCQTAQGAKHPWLSS